MKNQMKRFLFCSIFLLELVNLNAQTSECTAWDKDNTIQDDTPFGRVCTKDAHPVVTYLWEGKVITVNDSSGGTKSAKVWIYNKKQCWNTSTDCKLDSEKLTVILFNDGNYIFSWESAPGNGIGASFMPEIYFYHKDSLNAPTSKLYHQLLGDRIYIKGEGDHSLTLTGQNNQLKDNFELVNLVRFRLHNPAGMKPDKKETTILKITINGKTLINAKTNEDLKTNLKRIYYDVKVLSDVIKVIQTKDPSAVGSALLSIKNAIDEHQK